MQEQLSEFMSLTPQNKIHAILSSKFNLILSKFLYNYTKSFSQASPHESQQPMEQTGFLLPSDIQMSVQRSSFLMKLSVHAYGLVLRHAEWIAAKVGKSP